MVIKKKFSIMILGVFLAMPIALANNIKIIPGLAGRIDISKILYCEKNYQRICSAISRDSTREGFIQQQSCVEEKMARDKSCIQASKIRQSTGYPPTNIRKYGLVTVFNVTTLADGVDIFYMVDTKGHLIGLTTDLDLSTDRNFQLLKEKFPNVVLTAFIFWSKIHQDIFPGSHILFNKTQQIVFQQDLRNGFCVACGRIGIANIAYEFNKNGVYMQSKLLKITSF